MIGDKFDFNEKLYELKREVSFGEFKKISKLSNSLQTLTKKYDIGTEEEKIKIIEQFSQTTEDQLDTISNFIESMLGLTQVDIDNLSLTTAILLFDKTFTLATQVKKKSEII